MAKVVTFGEIMLRLTTPGFQRHTQAVAYEATFGGAEANVAQSLANFGVEARYVTALPNNPIGDACVRQLRSFGVDTGHIVRKDGRIGIYFVETGTVQRPSKVLYDRAHSCIAEAGPGDIDWDAAFEDADWFHWTGITPAISEGAAALCLEGAQRATEKGLTISCDLNFRSKLWKWGKAAGEVMSGLVEHVQMVVGNEEDADKVFGIKAPHADVEAGRVEAEDYRYVAEKMMERFPGLKKVAITLRGSLSASHNTWSGVLYDGETLYTTTGYDVTHIVDRVGSGDSFAAGLIRCLREGRTDQAALDFAAAASCLKHTMPGDVNHATVEEVETLLKSGGSGRVQR
ncbi:MAG: sugar kinase [Candidatus Brocadiia bacterium]|jgi:2-dehydro-3-deoxygluconokinase|nr:sugar kinase [Candidatus Brocadiia bacterium]